MNKVELTRLQRNFEASMDEIDTLENSKIYRTDEDGSILFKIKNNKFQIETYSP